MTPVEQAAYNLGFARGSGDEGAYQREITRLRDCWAEALANYAKQNSEVEQLRGTLSLAKEGLANYAQENQRMRDLLVVASEALSAFTTTYNGRPSRFAEAERASGEIIMAAGDKVDQFLYPDLYSSEPQTQPQLENNDE